MYIPSHHKHVLYYLRQGGYISTLFHQTWEPEFNSNILGGQKTAPFLYALSSSNINRFSKLFDDQN